MKILLSYCQAQVNTNKKQEEKHEDCQNQPIIG